jgi:deoxyadenosine/deoxycytidine kinase
MRQITIVFGGVDKSGKTTIATELSQRLEIPYFKNPMEHNFNRDYYEALHYESSFFFNFLKQTRYSVIRDRGDCCEFAYSQGLGRITDLDFIFMQDKKFREVNLHYIYCYKTEYKNYIDEYLQKKDIKNVQKAYQKFFKESVNPVLFLDTTDENLENQITTILEFI